MAIVKTVTLKQLSSEVDKMTEPTLYEKLSLIQCELKAPKSQFNKFGNYYYRSCEDILEAVKPLCNKYKVTLIISDEIVCIEGWHYIKAIATLNDWESGVAITNSAYARESATKKGMDDSQVTGSTSTYARKYALNGLFNIDDTKDSDTPEAKTESAKKAEKENQEQRKRTEKIIIACINSLVDEFNVDINGNGFQSTMKGKINCGTLVIDELPDDKIELYAKELIKVLEAKRAKAKEKANAKE